MYNFLFNLKINNYFLLIFLTIIYILINYFLENQNKEPNYLKIKQFEDSITKTFINIFFSNYFCELKRFRENIKENIHINYNGKKNENPDVSVIITVYNQANCFYKALRSVQMQTLKNIEIIIVDDCSLDNSIDVIEQYMKEDNRIILLKHERNNGKIKSRSDGIKISKAKYISILDGDDSFSNKNILYNSFSIAKLGNLDIVEFNLIFYRNRKFQGLINYNMIKNLNNRIIYQPELHYKFIYYSKKDSDIGFVNRNIVSKLIKRDLFINILEYISPNYTEHYMLDYEDSIMSISLFSLANSYYHMKEYGYYYAKEECQSHYECISVNRCKQKRENINIKLDPIKYLNFLIDKYNNSEIENYLLYKELVSIDCIKHLDNYITDNFSYVYLIIDKIKSINRRYKKRIDKISKIKEKLQEKENLLISINTQDKEKN